MSRVELSSSAPTPMRPVMVRLPESLCAELAAIAAEEERSVSYVIRRAAALYVRRRNHIP